MDSDTILEAMVEISDLLRDAAAASENMLDGIDKIDDQTFGGFLDEKISRGEI